MTIQCLGQLCRQSPTTYKLTDRPLSSYVWASIPKEAEAVFQWKMSSGNKNNPSLTSWNGVMNNSSSNPCTWFGVLCDQDLNHISGLNLTDSILNDPPLSSYVWASIPKEAEAIFQWKMTSGNKNNPSLTSWNGVINNSSSNPCTWFGVSCDMDSNHVTGLNLTDSRLNGTLLNFPFSSLPNLDYLDLSNNQLSGRVPKDLGNLTLLAHLVLDSNEFVGQIPEELGYLTQLRVLDLADNQIRGSIPKSLGNLTNLTGLFLSRNQLSGPIPEDLGNMKMLSFLDLSNNSLSGQIPSSLGNLTSLSFMFLLLNQLSGSIPPQLGNLKGLNNLDLSTNQLTGSIPTSLTNMTSLTFLYLYKNELTGSIPREIGNLKLLVQLQLLDNHLSGSIPTSIGNLTRLATLLLRTNQLSGSVPAVIGELNSLTWLHLSMNQLSGPVPSCLGNLTGLRFMSLYQNQLSGSIPEELGNLKMLISLSVEGNRLTGQIPSPLGNLTSLSSLYLYQNQLSGSIPPSLGNLKNLDMIDFSGNQISGSIPKSLGNMANLTFLSFSRNQLSGSIPHEFEKLARLSELRLSSNLLTGDIPKGIGEIKSMLYLQLHDNHLHGALPQELGLLTELLPLNISLNLLNGSLPQTIGNCKQLVYLNLSNNFLTQEIPAGIGELVHLSQFDLGNNMLTGKIPSLLANLQMLELLNLSHNQLSGQIPEGLAEMPNVLNVDLSFNNLEGLVPTGKSFANLTTYELQGNPHLCGNITGLQACPSPHSKNTKPKLVLIIVLPLLGSLTLLCISIAIFFCCFRIKKLNVDPEENRTISNGNFFYISTFDGKQMYKKILEATEDFNEAYSIGEGGFGRVYKAQLSPTQVVAVKRLHALPNMSERNDFLNEIKALTVIRHRNIVRLHGFCSSNQHSFLIYEYLEKGSLASILRTNESAVDLDWEKRMNIIKGIANALSYMHHDCSPPIVHRDISSKNILLDSESEACVSDFGTAKFLKMDSLNQSSIGVVGTFGYMAPELAQSARVTEKIDVFSFGVLTLEIIRGEYPTNHNLDPASETPIEIVHSAAMFGHLFPKRQRPSFNRK